MRYISTHTFFTPGEFLGNLEDFPVSRYSFIAQNSQVLPFSLMRPVSLHFSLKASTAYSCASPQLINETL